jgi:hypothetical protein
MGSKATGLAFRVRTDLLACNLLDRGWNVDEFTNGPSTPILPSARSFRCRGRVCALARPERLGTVWMWHQERVAGASHVIDGSFQRPTARVVVNGQRKATRIPAARDAFQTYRRRRHHEMSTGQTRTGAIVVCHVVRWRVHRTLRRTWLVPSTVYTSAEGLTPQRVSVRYTGGVRLFRCAENNGACWLVVRFHSARGMAMSVTLVPIRPAREQLGPSQAKFARLARAQVF